MFSMPYRGVLVKLVRMWLTGRDPAMRGATAEHDLHLLEEL